MAHIMIVDDDKHTCQHIRELLVGFGYDASYILKPEIFFKRLETLKVDLVLLDIYMPKLDGLTLLKQIKSHPEYRSISAIMFTSENNPLTLAECLENGATDFMNKPIQPLILKARVKNALDAKSDKDRAEKYMDELQQYRQQLENLVEARTAELTQTNTQLLATNQELKDTQAQLAQSSKLAALGELATGVAHELNQPLFTIRMAATNLIKAIQRQITDDPIPSLEKITRQVDRAAKIINHLRTFGRDIVLTEKKTAQVNQIINDALSLVSEQLKLRNISIILELNEALPSILCQSIQIEQVLINLLHNARDALDNQKTKKIYLRSYMLDSQVVIEVEDTGEGIPVDIADKVFDPFFTTKAVGKGTGLGLSISYGIIKEHNGLLEAGPHQGRGALFRVKLPVLES